jgi:hypothetical protein
MTPRGKDRWQSLPDVVAQLQAEAANLAISRPRIAWPDEPVRADDARPTVQGHRGHEHRPQPAAAAAIPAVGTRRDPATEPPATQRIDWGGLCDYDRLAADPRPDLRALGLLLVDVCQRSCGTRYRSIERLVGDVNRRIDKLLADPDAASRRAQRQALYKRLDRIEDLLVSLMVNP